STYIKKPSLARHGGIDAPQGPLQGAAARRSQWVTVGMMAAGFPSCVHRWPLGASALSPSPLSHMTASTSALSSVQTLPQLLAFRAARTPDAPAYRAFDAPTQA